MLPSFSMEADAGSRKNSVLMFLYRRRGLSRTGRFHCQNIFADEPVEFFKPLAHLAGIGGAHGVIRADAEKSLDLSFIHLIEHVHRGIVLAVVHFGKPRISEIVFLGRRLVKPGLKQADHELRVIRIIVGRLGVLGDGRVFLQVFIKRIETRKASSDSREECGKGWHGRWNPERWVRRAWR